LKDLSKSMSRMVKRNYWVTLLPGLVGLGGIVFFNMGAYGSSWLYISSILLGSLNGNRKPPVKMIKNEQVERY
jgi:hypothetical protein